MKKISIFQFLFVTIFFVSISTLLFVFYSLKTFYSNYQEELLDTTIKQINQNIIEKTTQYLMPATVLAESSSKLIQSNVLNPKNTNQMESYLITQLTIFPQLSKMYHADESGHFIMVYRNNEKGLSTKIIDPNSKKAAIKQYNGLGHLIKHKKEKNMYDARKRSWYTGAKSTELNYWTDLYIFYTGKIPGITASFPIFNQQQTFLGAFGVDVELSKISEFLSVQKNRYNATIMVLNDKDQLVAKADSVAFNTLDDGSVEPLLIDQLNDPLVSNVVIKHEELNQDQFKLNWNNKKFMVSYIRFPDYFGKNWKILTIVPEKQIVKSLFTIQLNLPFLVFIFTLISMLVSFFISRSLTRPLKQLAFDIERLVYGNTQSASDESFVKEVFKAQQSLNEFKIKFKNRS